jgi:allantoin racemase
MKLLVINPNTTATMTRKIDAVARSVARSGTQIVTEQPQTGPASIQGYLDIARSLNGILDIAERHRDADATVVACFDDTGIDALRCVMAGPVIGIGEASFHAASMISCRFSVVTTLARSVAGLSENIAKYGLNVRCSGVRAADVPVLALENDPTLARTRIEAQVQAALTQDGAEAIVLGCSGMADLAENLTARFGVPVIEGVSCAVAMAEAFVAAGLLTSKAGAYANATQDAPNKPRTAIRN